MKFKLSALLLAYSSTLQAVDAYDPNLSYQGGEQVSYNGETYLAQWWVAPNQSPEVVTDISWESPWILVVDDEADIPPQEGEYSAYTEGKQYLGGDIVLNHDKLYRCLEEVTQAWCSGAAWAYEPGKGAQWQQAWVEVDQVESPIYYHDFVVEVSQDTYVDKRSGYRDNNYNHVNSAPVVSDRYSLLQFDLDATLNPNDIDSVYLMLFFSNNKKNSEIIVHETSSDWDETTVTWRDAPERGAELATELAPDGYKYIDVTEHIKSQIQQGTAAFYLRGMNNQWDSIFVNNDYRKPRLIFRTVTDTEPSTPKIWQNYVDGNTSDSEYQLYNWSNVGYQSGQETPDYPEPVFHVADFGALPDNGQDDTQQIQNAINAAGEAGGGIVQFDAGQYDININPDEEYRIINVLHSNVFLKGANAERETVLKQWKPVERSSHLFSYVRTPHTINFGRGTPSVNGNILIKEPAEALSKELTLASTSSLKVGDPIDIYMYSGSGGRELPNKLKAPATASWTPYAPFQMLTRVARIIDDSRIEIDNPLPEPLELSYTPRVIKSHRNTRNVGIEDIHIITASDEPYAHGVGNMGYGWGGVAMYSVMDGYIRNLHIDNAVQDITIINSSNVSAYDIIMTDSHGGGSENGYGGHSGVGFIGSDFSLVKDIQVYAPRTHLIQYNAMSVGNVVTGVDYLAEKEKGYVDHHQVGYGSRNLIENSRNLRADNAGSSGRFNVFWNINSEMFNNNIEFFKMSYNRMPKSIFVGLYSPLFPEQLTTVNNKYSDQENEWYYLEKMNRSDLTIPSIYEAQRELNYINGAFE